jgi:hypothetical protein
MDWSKSQPQPLSGPVPSSLNGVFFEDHSVQREPSTTLFEGRRNQDDMESLTHKTPKSSEDNDSAMLGPTAMNVVDEMDR